MTDIVDLLIIGGGPAGLAAAINGASEGLKVRIMDNGSSLGGQARESSAIENFPGFPEGITGNDLMSRFVQQAHKFETGFFCPCHGAMLGCQDGNVIVTTDDYQEHTARAVLLSLGLNYRRLDASNIGQFVGRGVYYGVPAWGHNTAKRTVGVVGGANSAGQAVVNLAKGIKTSVKMFVRKRLETQMSTYLVDRIRALGNVEVLEDCEIVACDGTQTLSQIVYRCGGNDYNIPLDALHIFIGAVPKTMWVDGMVKLDEQRFIRTWDGQTPDEWKGARLPYATSCHGVFAAGDVRSGSTKRVATAVGEGAAALQMIHKFLA